MNKPVAWLIQTKTAHQFTFKEPTTIPIDAVVEPLYTHPVKELTDEEIWEVIDNCFGVHAFNLDYQITLDEAREDAFELIKAILRKAQEK